MSTELASGQDVTRLLRAEADRFRKWIATSHSRLDELIPVEFGQQVFKQAIDPTAVKWTRAWASYGARRRLAGSVPGVQEPPPPVPASAMFRRWAQLRMALEDLAARQGWEATTP